MVTSDREPSRKPSGALAGVAAALPTLFASVSCGLFALGAGGRGAGGFVHAIQEMGISFWGVVLATGLAWLVTSVLLFLAGRGMRVPAAITVLAAALPWLAGIAGVRVGTSMVEQALVGVDPAMRSTLLAAGVSEATTAGRLGAILASGFFAAVALGLALAALGQRAPRRSMAAGGIGLVVSLPLLGVAAFGALGAELGVSLGSTILILAGMGAVGSVALAAAGAGADEPHGRSGALAASAPIAAGLAVLAACAAAMSSAIIEIFGAIASAAFASRGTIIAHAALELSPLAWTMRLALPLSLIAAAAVAGWAAIRMRPSIGRVIGAAALVVAAVLVVMLDGLVMSHAGSVIEAGARAEWESIEGFEAVALPDVEHDGEADAVVTTTGLASMDGAALAGFDAPALSSALARLRDGARHELPEWLREGDDAGDEDTRALTTEADVVLAVDRRVSAAQLRALLEAAHTAGVRAIAFTGPLEDAPSEEEAEAVREVLPMLAIVLGGRGSVHVVLEGALPEGMADRDASLHHVTVGASIPTETSTRAGASVGPDERAIREPSYARPDPTTPLYVAFSDEASVESVLATVARATQSGFRAILVRGAVPGEPSRAHRDEEDAHGGIGLGRLGTGGFGSGAGAAEGSGGTGLGMGGFGSGAGAPQPSDGTMNVRGSLSREVIQRVVRRHLSEVRYCYERGLARRPELNGRVTVSFVISSSGSVQSAAVASSTLEDATVEACIVQAVRRWTFPAPDGGVVAVNYPFALTSE